MAQYFYLAGPLVLVCFSIPLALFAVITSTLAFSTLLLRVSVVYLELALGLVHSWLSISLQSSKQLTSPSNGERRLPPQLQPRKKSNGGLSPFREASSTNDHSIRAPLSTSESFTSLLGTGGPSRDFEGVGGWRLTSDGQDDAVWMGMNSRLQLPTPGATGEKRRKHKRSVTSQSQRVARSPEAFRMSPVTSRNRTPPATQEQEIHDSYFNIQGQVTPMSPEEVSTRIRMHERRLSISSSTASSFSDLRASSSGLTQLQPS